MDISLAVHVIDLRFSVSSPEESVSQNLDLGLSFDFMSKNG